MFPQLGTGSPTPRPKNDKRDLGQDVLRRQQGRLRQGDSQHLRQHVPPQQVDVRGAKAPRRHDVVPQLGAQHDAANQSRRARPPDEPNDREDQQKRLRRLDVQRQGHPDRKQAGTTTAARGTAPPRA